MKKRKAKKAIIDIFSNWQLYVFLLPGLVYLIVFKYKPIYGTLIAFKNYSVVRGFEKSPWCGIDNFVKLWSMYGFTDALRNTFQISFKKILMGFPTGPILAIMITEMPGKYFKKAVRSIVVLPHFISWVVVSALCYAVFSPNTGMIKDVIRLFGGNTSNTINLLQNKDTFQGFLVGVAIWKTMGWGSIIYIAAIAGIDPQLYEAAEIDGAGRLKLIWHVTLPGIRNTIIVMLILRLGTVLDAGFDEVFALTNTVVNSVADIIDTYVYRIGIQQAKYHFGAAAGLFKSIVAMILVCGVNMAARKVDPNSSLF